MPVAFHKAGSTSFVQLNPIVEVLQQIIYVTHALRSLAQLNPMVEVPQHSIYVMHAALHTNHA